MNWLIVVLRILHIGAGVFWAGAAFAVAGFVLPTVAASGAEGTRFMRRLALERGLTRWMVAAAIVTVIAGLVLTDIDSAGMQPAWMRSGMGIMIGIGALAALGALFVGIRSAMVVVKLGKLLATIESQGGAPKSEQVAEAQAMGAAMARRARAVAIQLVIAVLCMAAARYVVF